MTVAQKTEIKSMVHYSMLQTHPILSDTLHLHMNIIHTHNQKDQQSSFIKAVKNNKQKPIEILQNHSYTALYHLPLKNSFHKPPMAAFLLTLLILTIAKVSDGAWCVCRSDVSEASLQKTLDFACGAGADCKSIKQGGACYNPDNVRAHCSYAVNSYYMRKGQTQQACDFAGTASISSSDPSSNGCTYPATASGAGTGSNTNTPTSMNSNLTGSSPNTFTPANGNNGGGILGLSPSSSNAFGSTDASDATSTVFSYFLFVHLMSSSLLMVNF